jgi:hypothetical protein
VTHIQSSRITKKVIQYRKIIYLIASIVLVGFGINQLGINQFATSGEPNISLLILPIIAILSIITGAFAAIVLIPYQYQKFAIITVLGLVSIGFVILYNFPPFSQEEANAVLAIALLSPIAAFMIDLIKKRSEAASLLEESVGKYRSELLREEIKSMVGLHDELRQHSTLLKAEHDLAEHQLSTRIWNKTSETEGGRTGTMANLLTRRLYRYYYYIDIFNKFREIKIQLSRDTSVDSTYKEFMQELFLSLQPRHYH